MVNIPKELIKVKYKLLKEQLSECHKNKQYTVCIEITGELKCIQFLLSACQGDKEAKDLIEELR